MENFKTELNDDGILLMVWDMPGRSMNVLSQSSMAEFAELVERIESDDAVKGAILASGKPDFVAGADLGMMVESTGGGGDADPVAKAQALYESNLKFQTILRRLELCGKPVVAAINGIALGGGLEVTLACHGRIAADNPRAQLGLPESKVGLLPGGGGTQRLPRMIGIGNALPLILEGKALDPHKALKAGIVDKVVPLDDLIPECEKWIKEVGKSVQPWDEKGYKIPGGGPHDGGGNLFTMVNANLHKMTQGNFPAQKYIASCVYEGCQVPIDAGLRIETRYFTKLMMDPRSKAMIRSLFLSLQELNKGARRPEGIDKYEIKKLGILGAGMMGAGIAYVSAKAGMEVVLLDTSQEGADKGKAYSEGLLDKAISKGRSTEEKKAELLGRIKATTSYDDLAGADLIIEAVFEDRSIKADVTKLAEAQIGETAVFGSNTSTLPITGLAQASARPENFIGVHFFSPVDKMQLVEIIMGEKTSDETLAKAMDYVAAIKKTPIVVNDSRGFYTSRCFGTYVSEGIHMLSDGTKPAMIENCGKMTGMPMAPLALNDEVSLELGYKVRKQTKADLGDAYEETPADTIVAEMVEKHGRMGKKIGKGFYDYPEGGKKRLWPGLGDVVEVKDELPDPEELKTRFLTIQALEAARCFEEGVVTDVRDADVGAILGWGFAPWTGGPLSYIDMVGTKTFVETCDMLAQRYGKRFAPNALLREMAEKGESFYGRFAPGKADKKAA